MVLLYRKRDQSVFWANIQGETHLRRITMRRKQWFVVVAAVLLMVWGVSAAVPQNSWWQRRRNRFGGNRWRRRFEKPEEKTPVRETPESPATASKPVYTGDDPFTDLSNWTAYDAGRSSGLTTRGYFGAAHDGRHVYFAPCRTDEFHGCVLRYDSSRPFTSQAAWEGYDAGSVDGLDTRGYSQAVSDGRYVYFVPFATKQGRHARILRYDNQGDFSSASSWSVFDGMSVAGRRSMGYVDAVFDGRYVYFVPFGYKPFAHANVLRLDTRGDFTSRSAWKNYDASRTGGLTTTGYYGGGYDGRYVYFVPFNDGKSFHGRVLRYDTRSNFSAAASWEAYDAGRTDGLATIGYKGAVYDGRYMYFVPFRAGERIHTRVLRYDTQSAFGSASSWSAYDASRTNGLLAKGYVGAEYDGRYIYFVPYSGDNNVFHACFLRYDTREGFKDESSWLAFEASNVDGMTTKGYKFSTFDGRYIYFAPYNDGRQFSGKALRYDTAAGKPGKD